MSANPYETESDSFYYVGDTMMMEDVSPAKPLWHEKVQISGMEPSRRTGRHRHTHSCPSDLHFLDNVWAQRTCSGSWVSATYSPARQGFLCASAKRGCKARVQNAP